MTDPGELDVPAIRALAREVARLAREHGFTGKVDLIQNGRDWAVIIRISAPRRAGEFSGAGKRAKKLARDAGRAELDAVTAAIAAAAKQARGGK